MKWHVKVLFALGYLGALGRVDAGWAITLDGTVPVSITSDTAAMAKNMAFDEARRQILMDGLRQYADVYQLQSAISAASRDELTNLIATSSIDGERVSDTTYSANIYMSVDVPGARQWLNDHNVQNWLPDGGSVDKFTMIVELGDGMADWMELKRIARDENFDIATKYIAGNQITAELPISVRGAFTIAISEGGWKYSATDDVLRIWK